MATHRVTADVLNARSGPGTQHPVVTRLPKGTPVERLAASPDGRWYRIAVELLGDRVEAWVSAKHLDAVGAAPSAPGGRAAWLDIASREIGVREYPGPADNPRIVEYHQSTTYKATDDEVHWCSSFVNWCMAQAGIPGTRSAAARSWLEWGERLEEPRPGCIVVFRRGANPASGHVGFYVQNRGVVVDVLGGNQGNQVRIAPYQKANVLGYRWPRR